MHWVLKPRLYKAVATVAVLMVLSLLRVASLSLVMIFPFVIPGWSEGPDPESRGSGFTLRVPRNDAHSLGRLSNTRFALPSERSSVSGATALMRAVMPMVFLM